MKNNCKILVLIILFVGIGISHSQGGSEFQLYHSVTDPYNRTSIKGLTTYEHNNGTSHLGVELEKFKLGESSAIGAFVEGGYAFTNFKAPIELGPIVSIGYMFYDGHKHMKLKLGLDFAYKISYHFKIHLLVTTAQENWISKESFEGFTFDMENGKRKNILSLGISYTPYKH